MRPGVAGPSVGQADAGQAAAAQRGCVKDRAARRSDVRPAGPARLLRDLELEGQLIQRPGHRRALGQHHVPFIMIVGRT